MKHKLFSYILAGVIVFISLLILQILDSSVFLQVVIALVAAELSVIVMIATAFDVNSKKERQSDHKPDISNLAVVSTAHLSEATRSPLESSSSSPNPWLIKLDIPVYGKSGYGEYGWIIQVNSDARLPKLPKDLAECLNFAVKHGYDWLCFDSEGPVIEDLKIE